MIKRLKYKLLLWLLDDICERSECHSKCKIYFCGDCMRYKIKEQARKAYKLEKTNDRLQ